MRKLVVPLIVLFLLLFSASSFAQGTWVTQYNEPTGTVLNDVFFVSSTEGYAVGNSNLVLKTTNRGVTWTPLTGPGATLNLNGVSVMGSTIRVAANDGKIYTSTNDGGSWTNVQPNAIASLPLALNDIWFLDTNNGFVVGNYDSGLSAYRTSNGGANQSDWTGYYFGNINYHAVHGTSTSNIWAAGASSGVQKWDGSSWSAIGPTNAGTLYGVHAKDVNTAWVVADYAGAALANAFRTTDGGTIWTYLTIGAATVNLNDVWFLDTNTGWVVGDGGKIYYTSNGSDAVPTWTEQSVGGVADNLNALYFYDSNNGWAAGGASSVILKYVVSPTVTSISPTSRPVGWTGDITITGTNFQSTPTAAFSGAGVTVNSVTYNSSTQLTANISIASGATTDTRNITVTNPDTGAGTLASALTINPLPTVTIVTPEVMALGQTGNVIITGTNFQNAPTVSFGSGVTVNSVTYDSATQLTANISLQTGATTGAKTVTVTNPDTGVGTKAAGFTLNPVVNSCDPSIKQQGWSGSVEVSGYGFQSGATVSFSGSGISATVTSVTSTKIFATVTIASDAATGSRSITVTNPDGTSNTGSALFTVQSASSSITNPTVLSASRSSAQQGWSGQITITGTGFQNGATAVFGQDGIVDANTGSSTISTTFNSSTSLTINASVSASAAIGPRSITVTNPDTGSGTASDILSVSSSVATDNPSIEAVINSAKSKNELSQGEVAILIISGSNLTTEAEVEFSSKTKDLSTFAALASGIRVNTINTTNADRTRLSITVSVASDAEPGWRNITVKNKPGGVVKGSGTLADALRVVAAEVVPQTVHDVNPEYPNGRSWNPEADGNLTVDFRSDVNTQATLVLIQLAPPYASFRRTITVNSGDNAATILSSSDFGTEYPNGMYKVYVFDNNTGKKIAEGIIVIFR